MSEVILREATRRFAHDGFDGTSLQEIAAGVGIRAPSLLHHFRSKKALRDAVIEACLAHWRERLPGLLASATSGENRFDLLVDAVASFFASDRDLTLLICREALDRPAYIRKLLVREVQPWVTLIANYIRQGQQAGWQRPDLDAEAYVINGVLYLLAHAAASRVFDAEQGKRQIAEAVRILRTSLFVDRAP